MVSVLTCSVCLISGRIQFGRTDHSLHVIKLVAVRSTALFAKRYAVIFGLKLIALRAEV